MKYVITLTLFGLLSGAVNAQCTITPVITPASPILCPNATDTLRTTQPYQTYQWYKNNVAIPGATSATLPVNAANDVGYNFSVFVTQDTCSGMSAQNLVDGWVFTLPTVMSSGSFNFCPGDTEYLVLLPPYEVNIQWTNNNVPIPGATDDTLIVTQTGNYSVSGAPQICPQFIQPLGVVLNLIFSGPLTPLITYNNGVLSTVNFSGYTYQWSDASGPISGATTFSYTPVQSGVYTVTVTDGNGCSATSQPYSWVVGVGETIAQQIWLKQSINHVFTAGIVAEGYQRELLVTDITGRTLFILPVPAGSTQLTIDLSNEGEGIYMFILQGINGSAGALRVLR
ncbi:MAG: PKD domain-containing protein [Bacteroidetes bacterium]|nr:PKD domain-containing protein [Bacteroidota bacterium]